MTHITTKLAGLTLGIGLTLVALPLVAGAQSPEALKSEYANHRFYFSEEEPWRDQSDATARYAMLALLTLADDGSVVDDSARAVDRDTIQFLEDNIPNPWDEPELMAQYGFDEPTADYGMIEMTELERIAGRRNLDMDTIHFLEDNLWDYDMNATYEGEADDDDNGVDVDPGDYSREIPWQDGLDNLAIPAGEAEAERPNLPFDRPQLRAEEPN